MLVGSRFISSRYFVYVNVDKPNERFVGMTSEEIKCEKRE